MSGSARNGGGPAAAKPNAQAIPGLQGGGVKRHSLADFEKLVTIAKGSFGVVYKATKKDTGRVYALKQVDISNMNRAQREEAVDEARVLSTLDSKFIIKYYDCFLEDGKLNIVMQYAPNGTLHHRLQKQPGKVLPERAVWKFFIQALLGLRHIHAKNIIHRDVKSLNLFFDSEDNVVMGDLGIAKVLSANTQFAQTIVGTPYYLSPELCEDQPYNEKSDVWALGVVLYEMCTGGKHPFDAQNEGALIRKIMKGVYQPLPHGKFSTQLSDILRMCLTMDHKHRPDTAKLLAHPAIVSRARSLDLVLDPDAKNVTKSTVGDFGINAASKERQTEAPVQEAPVERKATHERPPLAEMPPPPPPADWELPSNPHLRQQMRSGDALKQASRGSQRVYQPEAPPIGKAGMDDNIDYPAYDQSRRADPAPNSRAGSLHASARNQQSMRMDTIKAAAAEAAEAAAQKKAEMEAARKANETPVGAPARPIRPANPEVGALMGGGFDGTDPFIAHQMAKLGVGADDLKGAMEAAAEERRMALEAAKVNGRGGALGNIMGGYGGDESFKQQGYGAAYKQEQPATPVAAKVASPARAQQTRQSSSPFDDMARDDKNKYRTASMEQSSALKNATYEPPKFARKRATDLMITGPSMRAAGAPSRGGSGGGGFRTAANMGYAASCVGSETTTVAPTSYYNP